MVSFFPPRSGIRVDMGGTSVSVIGYGKPNFRPNAIPTELAVDNRLYWYAQDDECLVGYDIVTKMWFLGSLHLHDHTDYVDRMNFMSHCPVRLAHLGGRGDQVVFCLSWVSRCLPRTRTVDMGPAKPKGFITRFHCMKFRVSNNSNPSTKPQTKEMCPWTSPSIPANLT